jgi:hypothetical protein
MRTTLAELQSLFQARLLTGDAGLLDHLAAGGRFIGVYDHAYTARLVEVMAEDFPATRALMGEQAFDDAARSYLRDHPSTHRSIRWVGAAFPAWLEDAALADLAGFEWALGLAFDAPDRIILCGEELAALAPELWPGLVFVPHPSLALVRLTHDVIPVWRTVTEDKGQAGRPVRLERPHSVAVWRDPVGLVVRYRPLEPDESSAAQLMLDGADFATICEGLAVTTDPGMAVARAATLIVTWLADGWLSGLAQDLASTG